MINTKIIIGGVEIELQSETEITVRLRTAGSPPLAGEAKPSEPSAAEFVMGLDRAPGCFLLSADLATAFCRWCKERGASPPEDLTAFYVALQSLGFRKHKRNGLQGYIDERYLLAETA